ncbi:serine/threonine-protein phosphatase 7 long form homolog [Malania oleifera]|uniref:serine/threonine-protein phosphatase 7 long form homolog n=1 Tax=Malania oleifera TaxID=397392 RepID=UPI0025AE687C|nr:serine/threonine-protein phosphatase 7 long form homolog [Malania oleifera]
MATLEEISQLGQSLLRTQYCRGEKLQTFELAEDSCVDRLSFDVQVTVWAKCHDGGRRIDLGPSDPSVLTMGDHHKASRVWADGHAEPLCCRGGTQFAERWLEADPRIVQLIRDAGFYGIYWIAHIQLDWHLVTSLVKRWRPETHTFHLPHGEATVTLQDVAVLFRLPIDGRAVTGRTAGLVEGPTDRQGRLALRTMCERLLDVVPPDSELVGARIRMWFLEGDAFRELPAHADFIWMPYMEEILADLLPAYADGRDLGSYCWGRSPRHGWARSRGHRLVEYTRDIRHCVGASARLHRTRSGEAQSDASR